MKRRLLIILIAALTLTAGALLYISSQPLTGRAVESEPKTFTQAICNTTEKGNIYCEDYEITCKQKQVSRITATGNAIYHDEDWQDPRGEKGSEIACE